MRVPFNQSTEQPKGDRARRRGANGLRWSVRFCAVVMLGVAGMLMWLFCFPRPTEREVTEAIEGTIIPELNLNGVSNVDAVDIVLEHVRRKHPRLRRVQLMYYVRVGDLLPSSKLPYVGNVSLQLREIPATEALNYLANLSNVGYRICEGRVYFYEWSGCDYGDPALTVRERFSGGVQLIYWRIREFLW